MTYHGINFDEQRVSVFCRKHGIRRLSLYGSILRADFSGNSDIDVLIEFPAGQTPSLLDLGGMQQELSAMLGREVDLKTPGFLSPTIRERILKRRAVGCSVHKSIVILSVLAKDLASNAGCQ